MELIFQHGLQMKVLPLGPNNSFYILDSSPRFQLQLIDPDLPAGDRIEYFIGEGDGELSWVLN